MLRLIKEIMNKLFRGNYFVDPRDGKRYRTVRMPDGRVWMAENLNFEICNSVSNMYGGKEYGLVYDWNTAMKVCPDGWHLPSNVEWERLFQAVGSIVNFNIHWSDVGKKFKSKTGWNTYMNGTDEYGFSALPGGYRNSKGSLCNVGDSGYWWSATDYGADVAKYYNIYEFSSYMNAGWCDKSHGYSVRCLRD